MSSATDVDVALALEGIAAGFAGEPPHVLLVDPAARDPLAETTVARRPRPGEAVTFRVERGGVASLLVESHGAWQLHVDRPTLVTAGMEVRVHVV